MGPDLLLAANLAVAGLVGLAVGLERERGGHTEGPDARFAGIRTFFLLGLVGGIAGHFIASGVPLAAAALLAGAGGLAVTAYAVALRRPGATADGTTETSALVVLALGALAGTGYRGFSAAVGAVVVTALVAKSRIQALARRIGAQELAGALQFAVLALVILPLLPDRTFGPWGGVNPRGLWVVVLIFAAVNYAGFVLHRWIGASRGYGATGLLGGLVSSTAITLQFSRRSREEPALAASLGLGIVAACTVLPARVTAVTAFVAPDVARTLVPVVVPPLLVGVATAWAVLWRARGERGADGEAAPLASPLRLMSALQMALAFQVALFAIRAAGDAFGAAGVYGTAFVLGLTDMDALTFSMARLGRDTGDALLASRAIGVGLLANTALKLALALVLGAPTLRRVAGSGLVALGAATAVGLWLARSP